METRKFPNKIKVGGVIFNAKPLPNPTFYYPESTIDTATIDNINNEVKSNECGLRDPLIITGKGYGPRIKINDYIKYKDLKYQGTVKNIFENAEEFTEPNKPTVPLQPSIQNNTQYQYPRKPSVSVQTPELMQIDTKNQAAIAIEKRLTSEINYETFPIPLTICFGEKEHWQFDLNTATRVYYPSPNNEEGALYSGTEKTKKYNKKIASKSDQKFSNLITKSRGGVPYILVDKYIEALSKYPDLNNILKPIEKDGYTIKIYEPPLPPFINIGRSKEVLFKFKKDETTQCYILECDVKDYQRKHTFNYDIKGHSNLFGEKENADRIPFSKYREAINNGNEFHYATDDERKCIDKTIGLPKETIVSLLSKIQRNKNMTTTRGPLRGSRENRRTRPYSSNLNRHSLFPTPTREKSTNTRKDEMDNSKKLEINSPQEISRLNPLNATAELNSEIELLPEESALLLGALNPPNSEEISFSQQESKMLINIMDGLKNQQRTHTSNPAEVIDLTRSPTM